MKATHGQPGHYQDFWSKFLKENWVSDLFLSHPWLLPQSRRPLGICWVHKEIAEGRCKWVSCLWGSESGRGKDLAFPVRVHLMYTRPLPRALRIRTPHHHWTVSSSWAHFLLLFCFIALVPEQCLAHSRHLAGVFWKKEAAAITWHQWPLAHGVTWRSSCNPVLPCLIRLVYQILVQ
jgi:hypothetical protein